MSSPSVRGRGRSWAIVLALLTFPGLSSCAEAGNFNTSATAQWLRIAGNLDETPEEIACVEAAMNDLLSEDELDEWLSHDPETITVEELQALPHAIEVADRCR